MDVDSVTLSRDFGLHKMLQKKKLLGWPVPNSKSKYYSDYPLNKASKGSNSTHMVQKFGLMH